MKEIRSLVFVSHGMEPFLTKAIDCWRTLNVDDDLSFDDQQVLDLLIGDLLEKECEKYGYKG